MAVTRLRLILCPLFSFFRFLPSSVSISCAAEVCCPLPLLFPLFALCDVAPLWAEEGNDCAFVGTNRAIPALMEEAEHLAEAEGGLPGASHNSDLLFMMGTRSPVANAFPFALLCSSRSLTFHMYTHTHTHTCTFSRQVLFAAGRSGRGRALLPAAPRLGSLVFVP